MKRIRRTDTIRRYTYAIQSSFLDSMKVFFSWYHVIFSVFLPSNDDCLHSLEPPRWSCSNEHPQSRFFSQNKANDVYPCNPHFILNKALCSLNRLVNIMIYIFLYKSTGKLHTHAKMCRVISVFAGHDALEKISCMTHCY